MGQALPWPLPWQIENRLNADRCEERDLGFLFRDKDLEMSNIGYDVIFLAQREEMPRILVPYLLRCLDEKAHKHGSDNHTRCLITKCTRDPEIPLIEFLFWFETCPLEELLILSECLHLLKDRYPDRYPCITACIDSFWSNLPRLR